MSHDTNSNTPTSSTSESTTTDPGHTPGSAEGVDQQAGEDQSQRDADPGRTPGTAEGGSTDK